MFDQETLRLSHLPEQELSTPPDRLLRCFLTTATVENRYLIKGLHPQLLLVANMHGDERETGQCLEAILETKGEFLPNYLAIPEASPSASRLNTRENATGHDLNRSFFEGTQVAEAAWIMRVLEKRRFKTSITFHEDPELAAFYLYDSYGSNLEHTPLLEKMRDEIKALGVELLTGLDDPLDPALGDEFYRGYKYFGPETGHENPHGFLSNWMYQQGIIQRCLIPEIPGKLPTDIKKQLIQIVLKLFADNPS